jgi:hypothetical protein
VVVETFTIWKSTVPHGCHLSNEVSTIVVDRRIRLSNTSTTWRKYSSDKWNIGARLMKRFVLALMNVALFFHAAAIQSTI